MARTDDLRAPGERRDLPAGRAGYIEPVPIYAAFLRGVNLGPSRRVSSADLRSLFEGLGFNGVDTFRTSGNVVFEAGRESGIALAERIERALAASLGWEVTIFVRTASQIRAIAEHRPFRTGLVDASKGKLQVSLLAAKPTARGRKEVLALATDADRLAFGERELYWLPSGGTKDSALGMKAIENLVGPSTMRTKATIEQLAAKYLAAP
jgi:uncharacterized protein (DUF1697 family)